MTYPADFEQKIGFTEIRRLLSGHCLSTLGKSRVEELSFSTDHAFITGRLGQIGEFIGILQAADDEFPCQYFYDTRESLRRIRPEGLYLNEAEIFDLRRSLETLVGIVRFLARKKSQDEDDFLYPRLHALTADLADMRPVIRKIDLLLDAYGHIRDNASAELARIRSEKSRTLNSISGKLNAILRSAQSEGIVEKDASPALRDGRLVLPVAPALKRKLRGIVHDESASGKTVFIEPAEVVEANNRVRELENEEKREIIRILTAFTDSIRPMLPEITENYRFLATIDFTRAAANFALRVEASVPASISPDPILQWEHATHPLLRLSLAQHNRETGKNAEIVPLDISLTREKYLLLISGPNAGGKSVCLKTVGLLQYMLQCGLPVPLSAESKTGLFRSIFIDIGDEQSIENELSTYSSHLTNMKQMLRHADDRSLILIDEFGGGTEPQIGGAIAEAILGEFDKKRTFGVITTHYQNLKHFADSCPGIQNGAMLYDRHQMKPLFQLSIGRPGSSFAIEIARKIGLPQDVIRKASEIVGQDYINSDKYLQDIVRDKRYWEQKRQQIHQLEKQYEQATLDYRQKLDELKKKQKEIIDKAKKEAEELLKESNARIERTIRQIKENQAERAITRQARQELEEFRNMLEQHFARQDMPATPPTLLKKSKAERRAEKKQQGKAARPAGNKPAGNLPPHQPAAPQQPAPLAAGAYVRIKGQSVTGQIQDLDGKTATVVFGSIKTRVGTDRLEPASAPARPVQASPVSLIGVRPQDEIYEKKLQFKPDIDVRGMRGDEAIQAVTYFIDDAAQIGMARVRILHGTGNGILRTLIRDYLASSPAVRDFKDEHVQFGGAGITVVDLE